MINLYEALKTVLLNESKESDIINAINNGYRLRITYDDNLYKTLYNKIRYPKGVNPTGSRTILPYCLGEDSRSGALVLRAFQITNNATRRGAPKWKYFKLDNITSLRVDKRRPFKFTPQEMGYPNAPDFNIQGDRLMGNIIAIKPMENMTNLGKEKAKTEFLQTAPKIVSHDGPIPFASQQRKKNVYTSQPKSKKYAQWAKNVSDAQNDNVDRFNDDIWAQAEQERQLQQTAPKPNNTTTKPINTKTSTSPKTNGNTEEEEDWEKWFNQSHGNEF